MFNCACGQSGTFSKLYRNGFRFVHNNWATVGSSIWWDGKHSSTVGRDGIDRRGYLYEYIASRHDETKALFVSLNNPHNRLSIRGIETILHKVGSNLNPQKCIHTNSDEH